MNAALRSAGFSPLQRWLAFAVLPPRALIFPPGFEQFSPIYPQSIERAEQKGSQMSEDLAARPTLKACWKEIGVWGDSSCPELKQWTHCRNCIVYSDAAGRLLSTQPSDQYIEERTEELGKAKEQSDAKTHSVMVFRIESEWLALRTEVFVEVSEKKTIHTLPHRRNGIILGLVNIRGQLRVCVSLQKLLSVETAIVSKKAGGYDNPGRLMVIHRANEHLVFPVSEVHGIRRVAQQELKELPATVARATATYTKNLFSMENKSIGLLDDELLFYSMNRSLS